MAVGGQIWGPGPQSKIFGFFRWYLSRGWGRNLSYGNHSNGGPLWCLKFKKKSRFFFRENGVQSFGVVALFRVRPLGGLPSPTWPFEILVLWTLTKIVFGRGRSPPIWWRYGVWPVCTLAHFFSKSAGQISEFSTRSIVPRAYYRFWDFKKNLSCVTQINFVQSWKKTR